MNDLSDKELFNDAIAEPDTSVETSPSEAEAQAGQHRDDHGRFAPKAQEPQAEAAPQPQPDQAPQPESQPQDRRVPLNELLEERKNRQQLQQQVETLMRLVEQNQRPQPQPQPQQPQAPQQPVDDLDEALTDMGGYMRKHLTPLQQQMEVQMEEVGKMLASQQQGGEEAVNAAQAWLQTLAQTDRATFGPVHARIMGKPPVQRYAEAVKAHKEHEAQRTVGTDPNAWFEKTLGEKLNDPAFIASLMEKARGVASQGAAQPGGRPATNVVLPPSISRMTSVAPSSGGPLGSSDADIYSYATS